MHARWSDCCDRSMSSVVSRVTGQSMCTCKARSSPEEMYRHTKSSGQFHRSALIASGTPNPTYFKRSGTAHSLQLLERYSRTVSHFSYRVNIIFQYTILKCIQTKIQLRIIRLHGIILSHEENWRLKVCKSIDSQKIPEFCTVSICGIAKYLSENSRILKFTILDYIEYIKMYRIL